MSGLKPLIKYEFSISLYQSKLVTHYTKIVSNHLCVLGVGILDGLVLVQRSENINRRRLWFVDV